MALLVKQELLEEKKYSLDDVARLFRDFYEKVKHVDEEHQKWLLKETVDYVAQLTMKVIQNG